MPMKGIDNGPTKVYIPCKQRGLVEVMPMT